MKHCFSIIKTINTKKLEYFNSNINNVNKFIYLRKDELTLFVRQESKALIRRRRKITKPFVIENVSKFSEIPVKSNKINLIDKIHNHIVKSQHENEYYNIKLKKLSNAFLKFNVYRKISNNFIKEIIDINFPFINLEQVLRNSKNYNDPITNERVHIKLTKPISFMKRKFIRPTMYSMETVRLNSEIISEFSANDKEIYSQSLLTFNNNYQLALSVIPYINESNKNPVIEYQNCKSKFDKLQIYDLLKGIESITNSNDFDAFLKMMTIWSNLKTDKLTSNSITIENPILNTSKNLHLKRNYFRPNFKFISTIKNQLFEKFSSN